MLTIYFLHILTISGKGQQDLQIIYNLNHVTTFAFTITVIQLYAAQLSSVK